MKKILFILLFSTMLYAQEGVNVNGVVKNFVFEVTYNPETQVFEVKNSRGTVITSIQDLSSMIADLQARIAFLEATTLRMSSGSGATYKEDSFLGFTSGAAMPNSPSQIRIDKILPLSTEFNTALIRIQRLEDSIANHGAQIWAADPPPTLAPIYAYTHGLVNFGTKTVGTTSIDTVYIKNTGTSTLSITDISWEMTTGSGRTSPYTDTLKTLAGAVTATIAAGDSAMYIITYTPYDEYFDEWMAIISHNASGSPDTISIQGVGSIVSVPSILYVSSSGNDSYPGTIHLPIKTVTRANAIMDTTSVFDSCLFKGGESFYDYEIVAKSNKVYGSYGTGNASIYYSPRAAYVRAKDNVVIRNLNFYGNILVRDVDSCVLKDLNVYGITGSRNNVGGIQLQGILEDIVRVERCTVKNFAEGIRVYGMTQTDFTNLDSLVIDACIIDSCYRDDDNYDGIRLIGNELLASIDYGYKAVIRNCTVTNWGEDAIDIAFASNVIVEKNILHDNRTPNIYDTESSGIKAGEQTAGTTLKGSTGNIIRYNKIYNINRPSNSSYYSCRGIGVARTNDILIHHNVIYNVRGYGIYRPALNTVDNNPSYIVKIYNNTISVDTSCVIIPTGGNNMRTYIKNNIFITKGNNNAIFAQEDTRIGKNVFVKRGGVYEGTTTRTSAAVWQKYNDVDSSSTSYYGIDSTALFPGAGDYEIITTSYTGEDLDLGYDIEGNAVDGTNPDCGAYEYDGSYLWLLFGLKRRKKHA